MSSATSALGSDGGSAGSADAVDEDDGAPAAVAEEGEEGEAEEEEEEEEEEAFHEARTMAAWRAMTSSDLLAVQCRSRYAHCQRQSGWICTKGRRWRHICSEITLD